MSGFFLSRRIPLRHNHSLFSDIDKLSQYPLVVSSLMLLWFISFSVFVLNVQRLYKDLNARVTSPLQDETPQWSVLSLGSCVEFLSSC